MKKSRVVAGCLLATVFIIGAVVFVTREEHYAAIKYQRECYEHPAAAGSIPSEQQKASADKCKDPKEYMPWWYILIAWPEGITTWAIIVTGFVIAWQSYETRKAAAATENAVHTADSSLQLQEDTAKRQLRAYMVVKNARLFLHSDGAVEPKFELDNCGQTPAYELRGAAFCRFDNYPVTSPGAPPEGIRKSTSVIGAGRQFHGLGNIVSYRGMGLTGLLNQLDQPHFVCCMNGHYTYRDIFKEPHCLKFQVIVGGPGGIRQDTTEKGELFAVFCNDSTGNESD